MSMWERRFCRLPSLKVEVRDEGQSPKIRGYAAVYYDGTPESEYRLWEGAVERIMPGAFDHALRSEDDDVVALFNHNPSLILGRRQAGTLRLSEDSRGLIYEIDPPDTQVGRDLVASLRRGDVRGSSFMFGVRDESWTKDGPRDVRELRSVTLHDVGPVTFPAYEATSAGVRSEGTDEAARSWKQWNEAARIAAAKAQGLAALRVAELYAEYL